MFVSGCVKQLHETVASSEQEWACLCPEQSWVSWPVSGWWGVGCWGRGRGRGAVLLLPSELTMSSGLGGVLASLPAALSTGSADLWWVSQPVKHEIFYCPDTSHSTLPLSWAIKCFDVRSCLLNSTIDGSVLILKCFIYFFYNNEIKIWCFANYRKF